MDDKWSNAIAKKEKGSLESRGEGDSAKQIENSGPRGGGNLGVCYHGNPGQSVIPDGESREEGKMLLRHQVDREWEMAAGPSNALVIDDLNEHPGMLMRTKARVQ